MKKSKITSINYTREYTGKYGIMYVYFCQLENGEYGDLNTKTKDKYKTGEEIEYTLESREHNGNVFWNIKPQTQPPVGGGGGYKTDPARELSIIKQSSLNRATELVVADKIKLDDVLKWADYFVEWVVKK